MQQRFETFTVLIAKISRSIRRIKAEEMSEFHLKGPHVSCLYYLTQLGPLTAGQLCDRCEEDKAAVSRSLEYLEQNGYVTRPDKRYRSPLTLTEKGQETGRAIAGKIDRLAEAASEGLTPEQRQTYTDTIVQQSERLAAMSTNILELTQYENTEIVSGKTLYSLDEQLRRCVRQQERDWLKKGLTVEGDLDRVDYYGNEELLEHIWSNLLSNAIRFTPSGGQITVVLRQGEGEVAVSVSDTGVGMDEETQRHIFDKFYRAETCPDSRGNGLGLSIVHRVVRLCGGQVTVFSQPGRGSTFTVTLPTAR